MFDQIVFPPYEGLPFQVVPPTVDGYIEPEKPERAGQTGVPTSPDDFQHPDPEVGYTHGARFSYDEGGGTGLAPAAFQGVWDPAQNLLYLGFLIRYDLSFDQQDRLVVAVRNNASGDIRRFDILPSAGAGGATGTDDPARNPNLQQPTIHIKTGRSPFETFFYQPNTDSGPGVPPWKQYANQPPPHFDVKVRTVTEDGGSYYWSIEVQVPTLKASGTNPGGSTWLDLGQSFGLYVNLIEVGAGDPIPIFDNPSIQSIWPYDPADPGSQVIEDPPGGFLSPEFWPMNKFTFGTATLLPAGQPNPGKGIKFQQGVASIGVLQPGGAIGYQLDMIAGDVDTLVARVINTDQSNPAPAIDAEFRLAEFGVGGGMPGVWDKPASVPNPSSPATVPQPVGTNPPAPVDLTSTWTVTQADHDRYVGLWDDQCLWVLLSSTTPANIVEASMRRNLTVKTMSSYDGGFVISGEGYPPPPGGKHTFLLHSVAVPVDLTAGDSPPGGVGEGPGGEGPGAGGPLLLNRRATDADLGAGLDVELPSPGKGGNDLASWLWVTNAYRRTGKRLTLGRKRTHVYVHAGSFGHLFIHPLEASEARQAVQLGTEFRGGGITLGPRGLSVLEVPDGGKVVVGTRFSSVPKGGGGGGLPWWLRFLRWLLGWLRRIWRLIWRRP